MLRLTMPLILGVATALAASGQSPDVRAEIHGYLQKSGMTAAQVKTLEEGRVIARAQASNRNDIVVVAAVKIRAPKDRVLDYYGQMVSFVDGDVTLAFGRFGNPPAPGDVKDLVFDGSDLDDLRACKPGKCDVRLSGAAIQALRASVDWSAADAGDRVNAFTRKAVIDYVTAYQSRGDAALITYDDRSKPLSLQEQWRGIIADSSHFHEYVPELKAYLEQYPRGSLPGARDVFYWSKEDFGFKPMVSIVHGIVYQPQSKSDRAYVVQKQLYASHYYSGSLAIATLASWVENGAPWTYLVYVNRSRGDVKGGFGLRRNLAEGQARKAAEETLTTIKEQVEQTAEAPAAQPHPVN